MCKSCTTCFKCYCMLYFSCDRSLTSSVNVTVMRNEQQRHDRCIYRHHWLSLRRRLYALTDTVLPSVGSPAHLPTSQYVVIVPLPCTPQRRHGVSSQTHSKEFISTGTLSENVIQSELPVRLSPSDTVKRH